VIAAARLVSSACALLVAIASARQLGPVGRGEIVFVITVGILVSELVSLGTNVSGRVQILRNAGVLIEDFLGLAIVLVAAQTALVAGVLATVGSRWFELDATVCAAGVGTGAAMFFAHMMLDASFAVRRTLETGVRDLLIGILPVVGVLIAVSAGRLSVSIVIVVTALGYISGGCYLWGVVRRETGPIRFTPSRWGPILRSGMPVLVGSFGQVVALRADRLILGLLSTSAALGIYSVAATAAELPRIVLIPASQVLANRIATGDVSTRDLRSLLTRLMAAYGILMVVVAVVVPSILIPLLGGGFAGARDLVAVLALSEWLLAVFLLSVAVLTGLGQFRLLPIPAIVGMSAIVSADMFVVPRFGGAGAAWVRVAGFGSMAMLAALLMRRCVRSSYGAAS
jgi:O-antigen/teichoic acid export membrane protein